jgi:hypothetical protein
MGSGNMSFAAGNLRATEESRVSRTALCPKLLRQLQQ